MSAGYPSLQKQAARCRAYDAWMSRRTKRASYHRDYVLNYKHIVVAGRSGDVRFLIEAGVAPNNIIACDPKRELCQRARELGCVIPSDDYWKDISKACLWAKEEFGASQIGSVNVDICRGVEAVAVKTKEVLDLVNGRDTFVFAHYCNNDYSDRFMDDEERIEHMKRVVGKQPYPMFRRYNYTPWKDGISNSKYGSKMTMVGW